MIQQPTIRSILDQIKTGGLLTRTGTLTRAKGGDGNEIEDTYDLSFSSEEPYERDFGFEILGHKKTEVELDWLKAKSAPLLWQHDRFTVIGVVEKANIEGGRGKAVVRFGKSEKAREVLADVAGGILRNVSVGYEVNAMELVKAGKDGPSTYRVTSWKPLEVSIVSIPADQTVGVGRSSTTANQDTPVKFTQFHEQPESGSSAPVAAAAPIATETRAAAPVINLDAERKGAERERSRVQAIQMIADQHKVSDLATKAIADGVTVEAFQKNVLDAVHQKNLAQGGVFTGAPVGGLSKRDKRDLAGYSFIRAINRVRGKKNLDGIEMEMDQEFEKELGESGLGRSGSIGIPYKLFTRDALSVVDDGAKVVSSDVMHDFFGALRALLVLPDLGASYLPGLIGDLTLSALDTGTTGAWEGEEDANADGTGQSGGIKLTPNRYGMYVDVTNQLLRQTSMAVEQEVRSDILNNIAVAWQAAAIAGNGANIDGILGTSGIGSVVGGTNGLAPTWDHLVDLETAVDTVNAAFGSLAYLTNSKVRGKLRKTDRGTDQGKIWGDKDELLGYAAKVTNSVPSTLTKGSSSGICSAIIFGNFRALKMGQWGGLDLVVDPYTQATNGILRMVANVYLDAKLRSAKAMAAMKDALTP